MYQTKNMKKNNEDFSVLNNGNFMETLRENVHTMRKEKNWTIRKLAEKADLSEDTLGPFLGGKSKDCNLSTLIKLAKALDVTLDELVGVDTNSKITRESLSICRKLPDNAVYLIRWYIRYIESLNRNNEPGKRYVSVMQLECNHHGNMKITSNYKHIDISHVNGEYRHKIFFGIKIPCEHYMPVYSPYDTLLIANDRIPAYNEHCLLRISNHLFLGRKKIENGITNYYSILGGKFKFSENEVEEVVGYVVGFLNPDGSWGIR